MRYLDKEEGDKTRRRIQNPLEGSGGIAGAQIILMSSFSVTLCDAAVTSETCWIWVMRRHLKQQPRASAQACKQEALRRGRGPLRCSSWLNNVLREPSFCEGSSAVRRAASSPLLGPCEP